MARVSKKKLEAQIDARIERIYGQRVQGVAINIMDIGKVFAVGRKAIDEGKDDQSVGDAIYNFVQTLNTVKG